ncbi:MULTISPECIES: hypothetical protein [unclassified Tolypothrix]|uniref:hypothetical protein n=1 Tax=unclassified Tolypothrix TaxID=2649714 RepID=UPI0005EAB482|nr:MULTISPECIES: hypothetical protein [unclassified Tolypothrix]BAY95969.1 hypothetical protein NIES3275_80460 [Microchaete diplosiphon NIES-3275]EKE96520.1 hypothetical protein FDUTEX481_06591 [Tolypothrix sp. PCC 7601]MBE9084080.1 hypothetical protein [Tolypothrix sp. LEGE 11397]UYD31028.1 hypothetical protein HGR01_39820 [Tolypothrix sp. PCC 7712]UYD38865.1 hypothetical protein HG267_40985 [Tolypothrix sp. PCC 7601]
MEKKRVNVYFSEDDEIALYITIEALAKEEKRSINQQIKVMLAEAANARRERVEQKKEII